jgi:hypothetical protein
VLAGGKLRTDAEEERRRQTGEKGRTLLSAGWERNEDEKKMSAALEKVAKEVGTESITAGGLCLFVKTDRNSLKLTFLQLQSPT